MLRKTQIQNNVHSYSQTFPGVNLHVKNKRLLSHVRGGKPLNRAIVPVL